jgi:hypothetical protein
MSPFFGLTPDYKLGLHRELFSLCYYTKGAFTWGDVYSMPIHLRRFYIKETSDAIERENKQYEDSNKSSGTYHQPNVSNPGSLYSR